MDSFSYRGHNASDVCDREGVHQPHVLYPLGEDDQVGYCLGHAGPLPDGEHEMVIVVEDFDNLPGGLGSSERLYVWHTDLLRDALETLHGCSCAESCPACVGPPGEAGAEIKQLAGGAVGCNAGERKLKREQTR